MASIAIYYKLSKTDLVEQAVFHVNKLIEQLETHHTILGVFLDTFNQSDEFIELLNSPLEEVDYIYMNQPVEDEFNKELISQLSRTEQFEIRYFN